MHYHGFPYAWRILYNSAMPDDRTWMCIALAYIDVNGHVLLTRRPMSAHQGGYWEFPGGKVALGESIAAAVRREVREELGLDVTVGSEIAMTRYVYPDRAVTLHLLQCQPRARAPLPTNSEDVRWVPASALATVNFPPANAALLAMLK